MSQMGSDSGILAMSQCPVCQKADVDPRSRNVAQVLHSDIRADDVLALFRKRYPYQ
jgi:hypothetical protein